MYISFWALGVCFACISIDYWICYLDVEYIGTAIICFYSTPSKYTLYNESIWNARKLLSTIVSDTTVFPLYFTRFLFHIIFCRKKSSKEQNNIQFSHICLPILFVHVHTMYSKYGYGSKWMETFVREREI